MLLPTLYARRSDGGTQQWQMEVEGDKYRVISGIINGQLVTSEWTIAVPKNVGRANATTAEQQALAEAKSHWQKKIERKYSQDINSVDVDRIYQCMLAKELNKERKIVETAFKNGQRVFVQPKLDGARAIAIEPSLVTRAGKIHMAVPHINQALSLLFDDSMPDIILDGELYSDKYSSDFNSLMSIIRKGKPTVADIIKSRENVQYHVYDMPSMEGNFSERYEALKRVVQTLDSPYIVLVETVEVHSFEEMDALYEKWMEQGYEGQMIRVDAPYENKRSKNLLKRKEFIEADFILDDVLEGVGNRAGMAARITIRNLDGTMLYREDGEQAKANVMGSFDYCRKLLKEKHLIMGEIVTLKFFRYGKTGAPYLPHLKSVRDYE